MKIQLHPDWKKILRHAWSIRFMVLAGALQVPDAIAPYIPALATGHSALIAMLSALSVLGAFLSRLVTQPSFSGDSKHDEDQAS